MVSKIIQFNRQLELPLIWWHEPSIWRERHLVSTIDRPTEDEALENVYQMARFHSGKMKTQLGAIEKRVYLCELRSFRECPRWFNEAERHQWISKQTGLVVTEIKEILATVDTVTFHQLLLDEAEKAHRDMVREVLQEEMEIASAAA